MRWFYKRGNVWWIDYSFRGQRHRESCGSHRKKDAKALLRKRMKEMGSGKLIGADEEKLTLADLKQMIKDDYRIRGLKSWDRVETSWKALDDFFGPKHRAIDITTDKSKRHIAHRMEQGRANSTIRNEVNALRRAMNLAKDAGRLSYVPKIPSPQVNAVREGFFTDADPKALLPKLPAYVRPVVRFAYLTGWRKREILNLKWSQVDWDNGMVRLEPGTTKNSEGRSFPFGSLPPLKKLMEEQRRKTRALEREREEIIPWVFNRSGQRMKSIRTAWELATDKAGLDSAWFHALRRSAVRNLEKAGVPRSVAVKLTGHKTESVYRRYAIAAQSDLEEGVEKLAKLHQKGDGEERKVVPMDEAREATG